jgi:hypothetical protein
MGTTISKVDLAIAETGIRNRIQDITSVVVERHALFNLVNSMLNYIDDRGETMLCKGSYTPDQIALIAQCLFTSLTTVPDHEQTRFTKIFLQNLLTERLNHTDLY